MLFSEVVYDVGAIGSGLGVLENCVVAADISSRHQLITIQFSSTILNL